MPPWVTQIMFAPLPPFPYCLLEFSLKTFLSLAELTRYTSRLPPRRESAWPPQLTCTRQPRLPICNTAAPRAFAAPVACGGAQLARPLSSLLTLKPVLQQVFHRPWGGCSYMLLSTKFYQRLIEILPEILVDIRDGKLGVL